MKNSTAKVKNILEGISSRLKAPEEQIRPLGDRIIEGIHHEQQKGKTIEKNQDKLRDLLDSIK